MDSYSQTVSSVAAELQPKVAGARDGPDCGPAIWC